MSQGPLKTLSRSVPTLVTAVASLTMWAVWLGWDQHRDVHPDGSSTGPYEAWQVIGLVLTLLIPVVWAASRRHIAGAVVGTTAGLTVACFYDWSDDSSGLFVIGVTMVMLGTAAVTTGLSFLIAAIRRRPQPAAPVTA
ncbi:hypothetical protein ACSCB1_40765 [Streptomyces europaeiscabiei]|uniref:Integral membrane protein n=1 Tax=Streptomyces europaeiscabiei TaxID=146819 RepID=A0ABU4NN91_9ACTN|nr:hypothetical protein [Streptomyces europaeiscabiei]MDX2764430.1 hypothetical protein [Streptomyces europaeiscabiei]MDX2772982.1 hypothetical protein [Streptomyces europaeiscabiei]MDX3546163.1 hypothetical protein [Streptomyces europaeiscabiei]MDX3557531.1 hypothetical protein [Streptomyces europaeiscabiei]MDX3668052.1 hypothetical protein [Streptomyces europaeiscabiei]